VDNHSRTSDFPQWCEDHNEIARLASYLAETTNDAALVAHAVEKPWHYTAQYEQMEAEQASADNALKIAAEA
jgi:hypothetical protein